MPRLLQTPLPRDVTPVFYGTDTLPLTPIDPKAGRHPTIFRDYFELVDWTGRIIRKDTPSYIDDTLPPILHRLQVSPSQWHLNTK